MKRLGDGEHRDESLYDVRRDGSGNANEPSALEKALMGRFDSKSLTVGSPVALNTIQTTSLLIPHALPLPPTPPSGVNTQLVHPTRADAACSIDISHETPPTGSLTPSVTSATSVKPEDGERALANELIDSGDSTCHKRRKTTGRYRVGTKKEVIDDIATEHPKAIATELDKTPMDSQNKDVVEDVEHASTTDDKVAAQAVREDPASLLMMP